MLKIAEKFKAEKIDGLFLPHCNFGTEYECARLAKELGVPVLLWGHLDERPEPNGTRLRDTQCGLFATGKVLRRFGVPFTYMTNCPFTMDQAVILQKGSDVTLIACGEKSSGWQGHRKNGRESAC